MRTNSNTLNLINGFKLNSVFSLVKGMMACLSLICIATVVTAAEVAPARSGTIFVEGTHFETLAPAAANAPAIQDYMKASKTKVTVVEFFSYGCHWCNQFEPYIETWIKQKPINIGFEQVPVVFHSSWQILSKAFFAAANLKQSEKVQPLIFKAIHEDRQNLSSVDKIEPIFTAAGIKKEDFQKAYNSFGVNRQLESANSLSKAFQITAIPAIVVMGPKGVYKLTSGLTADTMVEVINYLTKLQG